MARKIVFGGRTEVGSIRKNEYEIDVSHMSDEGARELHSILRSGQNLEGRRHSYQQFEHIFAHTYDKTARLVE